MSHPSHGESIICRAEDLREGDRRGFRVLYRGESTGALLIRRGGVARAWLNRCVHMGRALDSEDDEIFDPNEGLIRCSNHGITYDSDTGACRAALCAGKSLVGLRIQESDGWVRLVDRHAVVSP